MEMGSERVHGLEMLGRGWGTSPAVTGVGFWGWAGYRQCGASSGAGV